MPKQKNSVMEYRNYYLPVDFPVLILSGEHGKYPIFPAAACTSTTAWKSASAIPAAAP